MSVKIIVQPEEMAVSLDEARTAARVNGTDSDSEIMSRVAALTAEAEHYIGQAIINRTYLVTLPSFPAAIAAPALPIGAVLEITYFDTDNSEQTLPSNAHFIDESTEPPTVAPTGEWPATYARKDAVKVTLIVGHGADSSSTPPAFKGFILAKLKEFFAPAGTPESPFLIRGLDSLKVY